MCAHSNSSATRNHPTLAGTTQGTSTAATGAGRPEPLPPNTTTGVSPTGVPFTYAPEVLNAGNPIPDPNPSYLGIVRPLGANVVLSTAPKASLRGGAVALATAAASGQFLAGTGPAPKPVDANNDDNDLAQLPWAAIGKLSLNGGATFCTATLIHPQYVLTTGSCLYSMRYNSTLDDGCCASDPTSDCCYSTQPFLPIDGFSLQMNARADGKGSVKQPFGSVGVSLIRWKGPEAPYMAENIVGNGELGCCIIVDSNSLQPRGQGLAGRSDDMQYIESCVSSYGSDCTEGSVEPPFGLVDKSLIRGKAREVMCMADDIVASIELGCCLCKLHDGCGLKQFSCSATLLASSTHTH